MHFERRNDFQNAWNYIFSQKKKKLKKYMCLPYLKLSDPLIPETHFFFTWPYNYSMFSFAKQIVLAGDPLQLGPVLRSKFAKQFGLELSFLERLINTLLYERNEDMFADHGSYDPLLVRTTNYSKYSKTLNIFSFCSQIKCWLSGLKFTKGLSEKQTVNTLIRLLLQKQSDLNLHFLTSLFWAGN